MVGRLIKRRGVLSRREAELRVRERALLERTSRVLDSLGGDAAGDDRRHMGEAERALEGFFLLVVAGEFNSGKSSVINVLIGERVLPEGVTPTTDRINLLHHGEQAAERVVEEFVLERTHPAELLRDLTVVDTPGTNAVIRRHEELTRDFVPRSDLILFVTSADRPFTESERDFLEHLRGWGKKVVFIVNKLDILASEEEVEEVVEYVRRNGETVLGESPQVFPVSARLAQRAREQSDDGLWRSSGFDDLEAYLLETLDEEERVRLKLLNPLNVAIRLAASYREEVSAQMKLVADDVQAIKEIDGEVAAFHASTLSDLETRLGRLEALINGMETRGLAFFDETVRIGRIRSLFDSDAIRREFEREVIGETPAAIDAEVGGVIDWLVERNLALWQRIEALVADRRHAHAGQRLIGDVPSSFSYNRQALLDSIGQLSRRVIGGYNRDAEARALANEVHAAFATTALAEVGAVGLGALVATVVTGAAADLTGILLAATLAVGGLWVIPSKRRKAKRDFRSKISQLRGELVDALTRQVHLEVETAGRRVAEAIAPYRRFVDAKQRTLREAHDELVVVEEEMKRLRAEIERSTATAV